MWDADFYVKVDDDVHVNIGKLIAKVEKHFFFPHFVLLLTRLDCFVEMFTATLGETLVRHRKKPRVYIGCMKSGPVLSQK